MKLRTRLAILLLPLALLAGCQDDPQADFASARDSFAQGDYVAAANAATTGLRAAPDDVAMLRLLADSQLRSGDADGAARTIDRVERGGLEAPEVARLRAELALLEGEPQRALALVGKDGGADTRFVRAEALRQLGRQNEATAIFEAGLAEGKDVRLATAYARARLTQGDTEGAARIYQRMREFAPKAYATRVLEGDLADAQGQTNAAIRAFAGVMKDFPNRAEPMIVLAALLDEKGKVKQAQAVLDKAEAIAPNDERLFALRVQLLSEQGKWKEIREALQGRESTLEPASALGMSYGEALLRLGHPEQARVLLSRAVLMRPQNPYPRMLLGEAQLATGDAEGAWDTLRPVAERPDANPQLLDVASKAAKAVGDPAAAGLSARLHDPAAPWNRKAAAG
ncbi:tetratricopeptide repeat protein [Novosphingobium aquimarinum]|uniref:tetratricopeptide repeat protein n=1 Tax=Novosphingobium aquimarinum TaxID=2682494 RepID=UPI0018DDA0A5|nr:tetratricopeptide repeat protein [Novosphingobium aquimarinum]